MGIALEVAKTAVKAAAEINADAKEAEDRIKKELEFKQAMGSAKRDCDMTAQERFDRDMQISVKANGEAAGIAARKVIGKLILPPL